MRHLFLAMLFCLSALAHAQASDVYRVRDRAAIPFAKLLPELRATDIIYVGELHQVEAHRRFVLDIIRDLHAEDIPLAVGIEMFRADEQATLDAWTGGTLPLARFLRAYADNWRLPWTIYDDMFLYAREHRIPLVGLNIPEEVSAAVARGGFASLTEQQRKRLPPGMSCTIDQKYREFIRKAYGDHGGSSGRQFEHFCEAQMVWDKSMAWHLLRYRAANPGVKLIVLTGLGHAWRPGIPAQVALVLSGPASQVLLPAIAGELTPQNVTSTDADFLFYR